MRWGAVRAVCSDRHACQSHGHGMCGCCGKSCAVYVQLSPIVELWRRTSTKQGSEERRKCDSPRRMPWILPDQAKNVPEMIGVPRGRKRWWCADLRV